MIVDLQLEMLLAGQDFLKRSIKFQK